MIDHYYKNNILFSTYLYANITFFLTSGLP